MNYPAQNLSPGDVINYRDLTVTIIGEQEADKNQFGLPWFRYLAETSGRTGYISFGPSGTVELIGKA